MKYIEQWLRGLGLEYIIPKLKESGITSPKKLAKLSLRDMYEVGVEDAEDRKKLYYLIQRLQAILNKDNSKADDKGNDSSVATGSDVVMMDEDEEDAISYRNAGSNSAATNTSISKKQSMPPPPPPILASSNDSMEETIQEIRRQQKSPKNSPMKLTNIHAKLEANRNNLRHPSPIEVQQGAPGGRDVRKNDISTITSSRSAVNVHENRLTTPPRADRRTNSKSVYRDDSVPNSPPPPGPPAHQLSKPVSLHSIHETYSQLTSGINQMNMADESEEMEARGNNDMAIRVVVRKRPISKREINKGDKDIAEILVNGRALIHELKVKVDLTKYVETIDFLFDDAFHEEDTNEVIYQRTVKHLVTSVFEGGKATCFAYGQTGSGKTYTMMGASISQAGSVPSGSPVPVVGYDTSGSNVGLYVLAAKDVFATLSQPGYGRFSVKVSCFEIYGGKLFDLLNERSLIKCLEDGQQQVQLLGLSEHLIGNTQELMDIISKALLLRSTGSTAANLESSRSHQILQLSIKESKEKLVNEGANKYSKHSKYSQMKEIVEVEYGKLSFIDLAGSEKAADATNSNKQTRMEGAEINTSLLALKEVIRSLRKKGYTPFRGSKLTQVLKDSFVGSNTHTCMIACISPSHMNAEHTLNTLRYADRVKEHQASGDGDISQPPAMPAPAPPAAVPPPSRPHTASAIPASAAAALDFHHQQLMQPHANMHQHQAPINANKLSNLLNNLHMSPPVAALQQMKSNPTNPTAPANTNQAGVNSFKMNLNNNLSVKSGSHSSSSTPPVEVAAIPSKQGPHSPIRGKQLAKNTSATSIPIVSARPRTANASGDNNAVQGGNKPAADRGDDRRKSAVEAPSSKRRQQQPSQDDTDEDTVSDMEDDQYDAHLLKNVKDIKSKTPVVPPPPTTSATAYGNGSEQSKKPVTVVGNKAASLPVTSSSAAPAEEKIAVQQATKLLFAHKLAIAEMVEVMKDEMELVQDMETADDRDADAYIENLELILHNKTNAIVNLQQELKRFQEMRKQIHPAGNVNRQLRK